MSDEVLTTGGEVAGPGDAPRELTARARRATWGQPQVRFWTLVSVALVLGMGYLVVVQMAEWSSEARLMKEGAEVEAVVFDAGGKMKNMVIAPTAGVDLTYAYNGQTYKVTGDLQERKGALITGQTIKLHVDPANPKVWTNRTEPPALSGKMMPPLLLLPPFLVAVIAAVVARRRVVGLWVGGVARRGVVVDVRQTPLAPLSQAVRCALVGVEHKRLVTVYVPQRMGKLAKGDGVWVVTHPTKSQRALAAAVFL